MFSLLCPDSSSFPRGPFLPAPRCDALLPVAPSGGAPHGACRRVDDHGGVFEPGALAWRHRSLGAFCAAHGRLSTAHIGQQRAIGVHALGLHDSNVGDALADQPPCRTDSGVTAADDQYIEKPITRNGIGVHPQALPVMHAREPLPFTRQRSPSYGRTEHPADLEQTDATIGSGGVTVSSRRDVGANFCSGLRGPRCLAARPALRPLRGIKFASSWIGYPSSAVAPAQGCARSGLDARHSGVAATLDRGGQHHGVP